jgi:4-hydroxy-tetrahydrodipicolinate synthase
VRSELVGCYALLLTPFHDNGEIDEESTRRLIDRLIENGVDGITAMGSVGEFYALSVDERKGLMRIVADQVAGRVKLGFGTSDTRTDVVCDLTKYGAELGGDFALVLPPYFGQRTSTMIYHHLRHAAEATDMEIMLYDGGGGIEIPLNVMVRLVNDCDNVNSAKMSMPSAEKVAQFIEMTEGRCRCFVGVPSLTMQMLAHGATGMSSGVPNIFPAEMTSLMSHFLSGDVSQARSQYYKKVAPLASFISAPNLKLLLAWEGVISSPYVRMPLRPLGQPARAELEAAGRVAGLDLPLVDRF